MPLGPRKQASGVVAGDIILRLGLPVRVVSVALSAHQLTGKRTMIQITHTNGEREGVVTYFPQSIVEIVGGAS